MTPNRNNVVYDYKVLAQTLAANVHNDKLSDAAFRQFVSNCVQEFIPVSNASMAAAPAEQFGAQKEMQLRTDIWQVSHSTVYKLQESGRRGATPQFQNEYSFLVEYTPLRGDTSSQAERNVLKEEMARHIVHCLNTREYFETTSVPKVPNPPSLKFKAFEQALNNLCRHHNVVLEVSLLGAFLKVRDRTEFDESVGTEPTYLVNLCDAIEDDWRTPRKFWTTGRRSGG